MAKSELTKELEGLTIRYLRKLGWYSCIEVGLREKIRDVYNEEKMMIEQIIPERPYQIVDVLMYCERDNEFRCYEIKTTVSDFRSKAHKSFIGNYNYYVFPKGLYEKVKDEIPKEIGVLEAGHGWALKCLKNAKYQELQYPKELLLESMVRSLYREAY